VTTADEVEREELRMSEYLMQSRIQAKLHVFSLPDAALSTYHHFIGEGKKVTREEWRQLSNQQRHLIINELIQTQSQNTSVVFLSMPPPPEDRDQFSTYLDDLTVLTTSLPPVLLVQGNEKDVITTEM